MTETLTARWLADAVGWALLQSVWQGALIGAASAVLLGALKKSSAAARYMVACGGLFAMAIVFAGTAVQSASAPRQRSEVGSAASPVVHAWRAEPVPAAERSNLALTPVASGEIHQGLRWLPAESAAVWAIRLRAWSAAAVPLWLAGVLALSLRLIAGSIGVRRLRRKAGTPLPDIWHEPVKAMIARLRIRRGVAVLESAAVSVPTMIGWLVPVVLLPASALSGLSPRQIEAIIAHELAHVRRHDYLVNLIQTAVEVVLFYHPVTWWLSRRIRVEREHCCDDVAAELCGSRLLYARALADLEALRGARPVLSLAMTDGSLYGRVRRLVGIPSTASRSASPGWAAVAVVLGLLAVVFTSERLNGGLTAAPVPEQATVPGAGRSIPSNEGVLQGTVVDARTGQPIPGARIEVVPSPSVPPPRHVYNGSADGEGKFEITGVEPNEYRVGASSSGHVLSYFGASAGPLQGVAVLVRGGRVTSGIDIRLQPASSINGRILDDKGEGLAGVEVELLRDAYVSGGVRPVGVGFAQSEEQGVFRIRNVAPGTYYVRAYASEAIQPSRAGASYVSTLYPGTPDAATAQTVIIADGAELFGIDFALSVGRTLTVSGKLRDPGGPPLTTVRVRLMAPNLGVSQDAMQSEVAPDGSFEIRGLPPGSYMLMVGEPNDYRRWMGAMRQIDVSDDVKDLEITAERASRLQGRILRDGSRPLPFDPQGIRLIVERSLSGSLGWMSGMGAGGGGVQADGSFWIECAPGASWLHVNDLPAGWIVKSVALDGTDITDMPLELAAGAQRRLDITLTNRTGRVSGGVADRRGRPVAGAAVVLFPEDRTRWNAARLIRITTSGDDGRYVLADLPEANYRVVAVPALPNNAQRDPNVLERLWPFASPIRISEGERAGVSLALSPAPDDLFPR
jgi:beta-lactamase regulating signal transducer with metallopeptidase domain